MEESDDGRSTVMTIDDKRRTGCSAPLSIWCHYVMAGMSEEHLCVAFKVAFKVLDLVDRATKLTPSGIHGENPEINACAALLEELKHDHAFAQSFRSLYCGTTSVKKINVDPPVYSVETTSNITVTLGTACLFESAVQQFQPLQSPKRTSSDLVDESTQNDTSSIFVAARKTKKSKSHSQCALSFSSSNSSSTSALSNKADLMITSKPSQLHTLNDLYNDAIQHHRSCLISATMAVVQSKKLEFLESIQPHRIQNSAKALSNLSAAFNSKPTVDTINQLRKQADDALNAADELQDILPASTAICYWWAFQLRQFVSNEKMENQRGFPPDVILRGKKIAMIVDATGAGVFFTPNIWWSKLYRMPIRNINSFIRQLPDDDVFRNKFK
jgi:hypothetical protein